ncbi:unnamed protein product [Caenorhabditis bovis]|uniref:Uncharacterized protein n=1 Tax=Caenorhabditis bovis TaxID=2654633 RepID=A0A8S1EUY2_9PELO|nr:unnamed protein product [Caenorhabditis bovis]
MTNQPDEELIPAVSSLLAGKTLPVVDVKRYDRETMMKLRVTELSMTRPDNLSVDFNGDDGKFSPLKWLEHRWEVEGIKNRPSSKKLESLCAGADDNTGLSPQRRAFSNGCRAPTDGDKGKDDNGERLGGHGKNWRNGSSGGAEKYATKGNDFKLPFQKAGFERGNRNEWKRGEKDTRPGISKYGQRRDERGGSVGGCEKLPEWADGPTTMDDMIELRGFEEPKKGKKKSGKEKENQKKEKDVSKSSKTEDVSSLANVSRPSSAGLANNKGNVERIEDTAIETAEIAFPSTAALPESDQELAALLGIVDPNNATNAKKENDAPTPVSGSRLSRFFANKNADNSGDSDGNERDENSQNPIFAKILGHQNSGADSPANGLASLGLTNIKGGIRLEDIEKGLASSEQRSEESKGNPLQDPNQQADLLNQLHRIAKQQDENAQKLPSPPLNANGARTPQPAPGGFPLMADPALLASFIQNPALLNAHVESQLQKAIVAATRANNGQQIPPQLFQELKLMANRNRIFLQQQTMAFAHFAQARAQAAHQIAMQQQQQNSKPRVPAPAMVPASVQRQLHLLKGGAATSAEKKEKTSGTTSAASESAEVQPESDVTAQMKRLQMQQNYNTMLNAMNNGLGMSAWRGQPGQVPQQVQMLMAQQQQQLAQAHHVRMMLGKQQEQMMMAKLFQMQNAQAQQQMQQGQGISLAPGAERGAQYSQQAARPAGGIPSELAQVGPIQSPLEKLLANAGVQASQFTGTTPDEKRIPPTARPMSLEEVEKELVAQPK